MNYLRYIGISTELLTVIFASLYFYKYKNTDLKYFLLFIIYIFINDAIGMFLRVYITDYNVIIYNISYVINFSYLLLLYKSYITYGKHKTCIQYFLSIYLITVIVNGFYENYLTQYQSLPYIIASFFLVVTITFYFIEILNSEKIVNESKSLLFWISAGLLLYYGGNLPFSILRNYYQHMADATTSFLVGSLLGIIMYLCFIVGFVRSEKK